MISGSSTFLKLKKNIQKYGIHHPKSIATSCRTLLVPSPGRGSNIAWASGIWWDSGWGIHQRKQDFHSRPPNLCIVVRYCGFAFQCTYCTNTFLNCPTQWCDLVLRQSPAGRNSTNILWTFPLHHNFSKKNMGRETVSLLNSNFHGPLTRWPCSPTQKTYTGWMGREVLTHTSHTHLPLWPVAARSAAVGASRCRGGNPLRCLKNHGRTM